MIWCGLQWGGRAELDWISADNVLAHVDAV